MAAASPSLLREIHVLYSDHHGWLHGMLRKKLGCTFQAADLAHDTFLRILSARDQQLGLREPRAYLTTVANHLLINHYRRLSLERAYLDALAALPEPQVPSTEQRLIILETLGRLDAVLDALPVRARTAFLLAQLEGLKYEEIAERLAVSVRTVKRYIAQALEECIVLM